MAKYKVTWNEVHAVTVAAEDEEDAIEKVGDDKYPKKDEKVLSYDGFDAIPEEEEPTLSGECPDWMS